MTFEDAEITVLNREAEKTAQALLDRYKNLDMVKAFTGLDSRDDGQRHSACATLVRELQSEAEHRESLSKRDHSWVYEEVACPTGT